MSTRMHEDLTDKRLEHDPDDWADHFLANDPELQRLSTHARRLQARLKGACSPAQYELYLRLEELLLKRDWLLLRRIWRAARGLGRREGRGVRRGSSARPHARRAVTSA